MMLWGFGVIWKEEGPKYALMLDFGGIVGGAYYFRIYSWDQAKNDIEKAKQIKLNYGLHFEEYLGIYFDCHELINENADLLEMAAEKLYKDGVLGWEFWEQILLTE